MPKSYFGDKLGIVRERSEAVELLKNSQIELSGFENIETAEVLKVLVKPPDDHLDGVVDSGDELTFKSL